MELHLLQAFVTVAERLSFTEAAHQLHVAQPALSRQIQHLEEELDVSLFDRDRRNVRLTASGAALLPEARGLIAQSNHFLATARMTKQGGKGLVRIAAGFGIHPHFQRNMQEHPEHFPGLELDLDYIPCDFQCEKLLQGEIDVGITRGPFDSHSFFSQCIWEEELIAILPRRHRLANAPSVRLRDLAEDTLILPDREPISVMYDKILELYRGARVAPHIMHSSLWPHPESAWRMIRADCGIGLGVTPCTRPRRKRPCLCGPYAFISLREPHKWLKVHVIRRMNEQSAAVLAFVNYICKLYKPGNHLACPKLEDLERERLKLIKQLNY